MVVLSLLVPCYAGTVYVKWDSPYDGPGNDWEHAYHTISAGITAATTNDIVQVAGPHTYVGALVVNKAITLLGDDTTVIDGNMSGAFAVEITTTATMSHFTVTNCRIGIGCTGGSPTVSYNTVTEAIWGRGIYSEVTSTIVANRVINGWTNPAGTGAIFLFQGNSIVCSNLIANNHGAGMYIGNGAPLVYNNTIVGNHNEDTHKGGGIAIAFAAPYIENNIIANNQATLGGAIYVSGSGGGGDVSYNTFYNNGDTPFYPTSWQVIGLDENVEADPLFLVSDELQYRLQYGSSCIGTGINTCVTSVDLLGMPRILGTTIDRGCYEGASVPVNTKTAGDWVELRDKPVTADFGDFSYIEEPNRANGIRLGDKSLTPGTVTTVIGQIASESGDLVIYPKYLLLDSGGTVPDPLGMTNKTAQESLSFGLRVRVWGRVTDRGVGYYDISDGSPDALRVFSGSRPNVGDWVTLCGISSYNGVLEPAL
jgi:hypothetical protein